MFSQSASIAHDFLVAFTPSGPFRGVQTVTT
jgi:hypothetical protein